MIKLTLKEVGDIVMALDGFNPGNVHLKTTIRLARNLRYARNALEEFDSIRLRIAYSCVKKQDAVPDVKGQQQQLVLTPEEQVAYQPKLAEHQATIVEVDLHPIDLVQSAKKEDEQPVSKEFEVDMTYVNVPRMTLSVLLDRVLFIEDASDDVASRRTIELPKKDVAKNRN